MAEDKTTTPGIALPAQWRLIAALLAGVCIALAAGYYWFLRTDYMPLYTGLRPADAAAIVTQLDAKGISHRLSDGGATILVPAEQADNGRLAVAGSDVAAKGAVGFELFNKSDMGLTDFAQKINYQRALQGELARTIMSVDGVETARVHLAIPERSLFRTNRSDPKAAVEVVIKQGQTLGADRVAGIQQLVASSVPDLALADVVVIDGNGRIVSTAAATPASATPELDEQNAAQNYFSARAKAALVAAMPGVQFDVHTLILPLVATTAVATAPAAPAQSVQIGGTRNFHLRITVSSPGALGAEDQAVVTSAVTGAVGLDQAKGDELVFQVGMASVPPPSIAALSTPSPLVASPVPAPVSALQTGAVSWWYGLLIVAIGGIALIILALRKAESPGDQSDFVERLRAHLGEGDDALV